jgi:hypothetical protein
MPKAWKHPKLGAFAASDSGWSTTAQVPAFKAFGYTGRGKARRSTGEVSLGIHYFTMNAQVPETPPPEMVALLDKVLADPQALVDKVVAALWDDFNGRGPDSGIWWHGDIATVNKSLKADDLPPPKDARDLLSALHLSSIIVFNEWWDYPAPIVYLEIHAAFESEHGVSILTNVDEILGVGFSGEATLWKHLRPERPPPRNPFV